MITGIIPEWQDTNNSKEKGVIALLRTWTGEMMNTARTQMKTWIAIKMQSTTQMGQRGQNE
eukprot:3815725-Pleurochrysis_carterae.AAC.1